MKLTLLTFQSRYLDKFVKQLRLASREALDGHQAVSLAAPTGSGKTVIATAAIERLFCGDSQAAGDSEAVVLWITDQPQLNKQTLAKMGEYSDRIPASALVEIDKDTPFNQAEFDPGHVYFLHTQSLGASSKLVRRGDKQQFTLWDTINNTIARRPSHFYVFIDEAHRGMSAKVESNADKQEASTIIQKFIHGSDEVTAVPLIVGISATLKRFTDLIDQTDRLSRPVEVPPEEVRKSGLIKETILLHHPPTSAKNAKPEMALLRLAADEAKNYQQQWSSYTVTANRDPVNVLLVVQVEDGPKKLVSKTDLGAALAQCEASLGPLNDTEVAHAFETHAPVSFGARSVRYVAPSEISADESLRVVFFKTSLNVGWDCPRAEVMMSFRAAKDATAIAQLVGRMVRTPFVGRIDGNEFLNTVAVCLPYYNKKAVDDVVAYLTDPKHSAVGKSNVVDADTIAKLDRAADSEPLFKVLERLDSDVVPPTEKVDQVARLRRFARLLSNDEIDGDAPDKAEQKLISAADGQLASLQRLASFTSLVSKASTVSVGAYAWTYGENRTVLAGTTEITLDDDEMQRVFEAVGPKLGDFFKPWWRARVDTLKHSGVDETDAADRARRELIALASDADVRRDIEVAAAGLVATWLADYEDEISALDEPDRQQYQEITAETPEPSTQRLRYPDSIVVRKDTAEASAIERHLYVDAGGLFPGGFPDSSWERPLVLDELQSDDVVGWLRNPPNKEWSFCVKYKSTAGKWSAMYPDFLFLRREDGRVVVDLLDPHASGFSDAVPKAIGLAQYAEKHGAKFGRMEIIIVEKSSHKVRRINLKDPATQKLLLELNTSAQLEALYALAST